MFYMKCVALVDNKSINNLIIYILGQQNTQLRKKSQSSTLAYCL